MEGGSMSLDATLWAWSAPVTSSAQRLVLLSMADRAGEDMTAFPSMQRISADTVLDIKTVKKVVAELIEMGLINDTGRRVGSTGRVRVFQLLAVNLRENKSTQKRNDSKNGMIPELEGNRPKNGTMNRPKNGSLNLPYNLQENLAAGASAKTATADSQEYLDRITKHERANQPVSMSTDWKPSDQFPALMMRAGLTSDRLTDELLSKFVIHYNGESKAQNKWESLLVTWIKREQPGKTASIVPITQSPAYREYQPPVLPERTPEMAKNARKHMGRVRELLA
jgi:pyocin large subunit-like protein